MRIEDNVMYTSMAFCMNDYFLWYTIEKANYTNENRIPFNQRKKKILLIKKKKEEEFFSFRFWCDNEVN